MENTIAYVIRMENKYIIEIVTFYSSSNKSLEGKLPSILEKFIGLAKFKVVKISFKQIL